MAVQTSLSLVVSLLLAISIFASLQLCKSFFISSQTLILSAGFAGSWVFFLLLTALSNLEMIVFHKNFQAKWLEVAICLFASCFACSTIHRVAVSSCILFSLFGLYYINIISQKFHAIAPAAADTTMNKKKKQK